MEEHLIKDPGIFILTIVLIGITSWYAWATIRMFRIMKKEFELKTKPKLAFQPIQIYCTDWSNLKINQSVLNIGVGYTTIEDANLNWKIISNGQHHITRCSQEVPIVLAPSDVIVFTFTIDSVTLNRFKQADSSVPTNLMLGDIEYKCKGLDELEYDFIRNVEFQRHIEH